MDNLLESKKQREKDRLRAQDVKIRREREQEGDEFADKEVFVTSAYKAQQEELDKLAKEEEKAEGMYFCDTLHSFTNEMHFLEQSNSGKNMNSFHRSILDRQTEEYKPLASTDVNMEAASPAANEKSDEAAPSVLKAGLNMIKTKSQADTKIRNKSSSSRESRPAQSGGRQFSRKSRSEETTKIMKQYEAREARSKKIEEVKREKLLVNAMSKKSDNALASARERFLARKKEAQLKGNPP